MLSFRFGVVEDSLREMLEVSPEAAVAFRGRLKHLQRLGFPLARPGRGSRVGYSLEQVLQLLLALQLCDLGMSPTRAARTVRTDWFFNRAAFAKASRGERPLLIVQPHAIRELGDDVAGVDDPVAEPLGFVDASDFLGAAREGAADAAAFSQPFEAQAPDCFGSWLVVDPVPLLRVLRRTADAAGFPPAEIASELATLG